MIRFSNIIYTSQRNIQKFSIQTTNAIILQKQFQIKEQFTRDLIQKLNENPDYYKDQKNQQELVKKMEFEQKIFNLKSNDKNPQNYLKLRVNQNLKIENRDELDIPKYLVKMPRPEIKTCYGIRGGIQSSVKKMLIPMTRIKGKHIYDAIQILQNSNKKSFQYGLKALLMTRDHAKNKDFDDQRLWIHSVQTNKQRRFKGIRYRGKMGNGREKTDIIKVKIILEEKPIQELYKFVLQGQTPPAMAYIFRQQLLNTNQDYEQIRKYQYILTSKGRQQRRLMLKRRVMQKHMEFKKQGQNVPKFIIKQKLIEEESAKFADEYVVKKSSIEESRIKERQQLFNKNEGLTA